MSKCTKCGKKYKLSRRDRTLRKLVAANARLFPAFKTIVDGAKGHCNTCYKQVALKAGHAMLGEMEQPNKEQMTETAEALAGEMDTEP